MLRPWHNHFDNYGNFMPGYCGGISLGSWRDLDQLAQRGIDPERRPVLAHLAAGGMEGLLGYARRRGYRERAEGYISLCHLCLDVREFLVSKAEPEEVRPREF